MGKLYKILNSNVQYNKYEIRDGTKSEIKNNSYIHISFRSGSFIFDFLSIKGIRRRNLKFFIVKKNPNNQKNYYLSYILFETKILQLFG